MTSTRNVENSQELQVLIQLLSQFIQTADAKNSQILSSIQIHSNTISTTREKLVESIQEISNEYVKLARLSEQLNQDVLNSMQTASPEAFAASFKIASKSYHLVDDQYNYQNSKKLKNITTTMSLKNKMQILQDEINKLTDTTLKNNCHALYTEHNSLLEKTENIYKTAYLGRKIAIDIFTDATTKMFELRDLVNGKLTSQNNNQSEDKSQFVDGNVVSLKPNIPIISHNRYIGSLNRETSQVNTPKETENKIQDSNPQWRPPLNSIK